MISNKKVIEKYYKKMETINKIEDEFTKSQNKIKLIIDMMMYEKNNKERLLRLHFRSTELRGSLMEVLGYPEYDGIFQQYERSVQAEETPGEAQTP